MRKLLLFLPFVFSSILSAQTYSGPESVEWDGANNRWLISNTTSHAILARSVGGTLTTLVPTTGSGPHGIEILNNVLYACCGGSIKGYDLTSGVEVFNLNLGGSFLNGLTTDGDSVLYVTDFSNKDIFRVNPTTSQFYVMSSNTVSTPNGILYDGANNRCIFVNWGGSAAIKAIDLTTYTITTLTPTTLGNCDGITVDSCGYYYVTAWSNNKLNRFNPDFLGGSTVVTGTLSSPADIDLKPGATDTIGIPNAGNNTCSFLTLPGLTAAISQAGSTLSTTTTFDTYQWYHDGVLIPGETNQNYVITAGGDYYCEVTQFGCVATSNTITSNMGIETTVNAMLKLFPNPATEVLIMELMLTEPQSFDYSFIDMQGRVIESGNKMVEYPGLSYLSFYLDGLHNGAYILQLTGETINVHKQFIVRK